MKSRFIAWVLAFSCAAASPNWEIARPGYQYAFPRDHFEHREYQTEWWYYTGNLEAKDGRHFGFELTFFRQAVPSLSGERSTNAWRPDQVYLAHFAVSNIDHGKFFHTERLNRSGPGLAGAGFDDKRYWNGNWQVRWISMETAEQQLQAISNRSNLFLRLKPAKQFVINGENGRSQKGPEQGQASHYISFTRLLAGGELTWNGRSFAVSGVAWMDHEFFTEHSDGHLAGWDWFSIQLDNDEELMLYRLRTDSGTISDYSSGTYIDRTGHSRFLRRREFTLTPIRTWTSADTRAQYPVAWEIVIPSLQLRLSEKAKLAGQELFTKGSVSPAYWEGAVTYEGESHSRPVHGVGYLEMTGYSKALRVGQN